MAHRMESLPMALMNPVARPSGTDTATLLAAITGAPPRIVAKSEPSPSHRTRIWELHNSLHCSIVGTCMTTGELRRLLVHLDVRGAETADDHGLHQMGVRLAGNQNGGAKHLQKALDRKHKVILNQFAKAKDVAAVSALWDDAAKRGDIPGAYWSVLTHPASSESLVKRVFGEVHMLSHLVGAANRADIRRLQQLEDENAALAAKLERQQRQLRDGFTSRDETIGRLNDALARKASDALADQGHDATDEAGVLGEALAERDKRLLQETAKRERLEERLAKMIEERDRAERTRQRSERECQALWEELDSIDSRLGMLMSGEADVAGSAVDLQGLCVLYVGGRANQMPQLKELVERSNGRFLHHDGGIEHNAALLPGLASRADIAMFPVDCVSHDAMAALKRTCRQLGKRYLPLRTASLASLLSGIAAIGAAGVNGIASAA